MLTLLGGAGIIIYLAAALVIPDEGKADSVVDRGAPRPARPAVAVDRGRAPRGRGVVLLSRATLWPAATPGSPLLLVGAAILWITRHGTSAEPGHGRNRARGAGLASHPPLVRRIAVVVGSLIALVLIAAAIFAAVVHVHLGRGVGDRTYDVAGIQAS